MEITFLTEFLPTDRFSYIRNAVDDVLSTGCVPIVAHVERYECMASNIENVRTIRNMGADIQINARVLQAVVERMSRSLFTAC